MSNSAALFVVIAAGVVLLAANVSAAAAESIRLDGDLGCDTLEVQQTRLARLQAAAKAAPEDVATLARSGQCRFLGGPFDVKERRPVAGGTFLRVGFGDGSLWVLQSSLAGRQAPQLSAKQRFGFDPAEELARLESGNLDVLKQIRLQSGGDLKAFIIANHVTVVHHLSDFACSETQLNGLGDGCTVSINVTNGKVRNVDRCSVLLRWRRPMGLSNFLPESGWARNVDQQPKLLIGALKDDETRCDRIN
jgi:hypothetical protein